MIVSDDDSAMVSKTFSPPSSPTNDNSSYSGSDDETIIESEQSLFLDASQPGNHNQHPDSNDTGSKSDPILGCDVGVEGEDAVVMAEFLEYTFRPSAAAESTTSFGDVNLDASDMDALLSAESEAMMLLPDICLGN